MNTKVLREVQVNMSKLPLKRIAYLSVLTIIAGIAGLTALGMVKSDILLAIAILGGVATIAFQAGVRYHGLRRV
jgi:thiosulfate reductase cytochrome b subunit